MTCLIEAHWLDYSPECIECTKEILQAVERGSISMEQFDLWKNKKLKFPHRNRNV